MASGSSNLHFGPSDLISPQGPLAKCDTFSNSRSKSIFCHEAYIRRFEEADDEFSLEDELQYIPQPFEVKVPHTLPDTTASSPTCDTPADSGHDAWFYANDLVYDSSTPISVSSNDDRTSQAIPSLRVCLNADATIHSPLFPPGHELNPQFLQLYQLEDELGSGGYGFVMTARHRFEGHEVAAKFIIKDKVPDHAWMEDNLIGKIPTEVMLLSCIEHENIVRCLDLFEDALYFYLVQELHGSPWPKLERNHERHLQVSGSAAFTPPTPALSPSASTNSLPSSPGSSPLVALKRLDSTHGLRSGDLTSENLEFFRTSSTTKSPGSEFTRRPSHDLFECIEQSKYKRLSENQARYVFSQVVDAVHYLDGQGIAHRDIKDENLVIDRNFKVKLIDFGSAAVVDPNIPRPYYTQFYGTTAYASPEILLKEEYQAAPAEIWTLGVLLSYLLTGASPFPKVKDAIMGRITLADIPGLYLSRSVMGLMRRCLDPNPKTRATIAEVKAHKWLL